MHAHVHPLLGLHSWLQCVQLLCPSQWQASTANCFIDCLTIPLILQWHATWELSAAGVQLILGLNGVIWVSAESKQTPDQVNKSVASEAQPNLMREVSKAERQAIARVANCIRALAKLYFSIHPASILSVHTVGTAFHPPCLQFILHMLCLETMPLCCNAFWYLCLWMVLAL